MNLHVKVIKAKNYIFCCKKQFNGVENKIQICKQQSTNDLQEVENYFLDEVYDWICNLKTNAHIFIVDLSYLKAFFP